MALTISVGTITTEDAATTTAPHKISNKSGKTQVQAKFTPTSSDGLAIRYWRINFAGGGTRLTGTLLKQLGAICGVSRCGAPRTLPLALASGTEVTVTENYSDFPSSADGTYHVYAWAANDSQGWSS